MDTRADVPLECRQCRPVLVEWLDVIPRVPSSHWAPSGGLYPRYRAGMFLQWQR